MSQVAGGVGLLAMTVCDCSGLLPRADAAASHAWNPDLAVSFIRAGLGDDGLRYPLSSRFVDLLKRGNCERDVLANHLPVLSRRSRHQFDGDLPLGRVV